MNIYLIRHGQTIHNQSSIHQYSTTPLSELGRQQAEQLAQRLVLAKIDKMYASPMIRAQDTAKAIGEKTGIEIFTLQDLHEYKKPSIFEGKSHADPSLEAIKTDIQQNSHKKDWHHSDEENFFDIQARAERVLALMEQETVEDILLVTHSYFITMLTCVILMREKLSPDMFLSLKDRLHFSNTGISHCVFKPSQGWRIETLNDSTHLS